MAAPCVARWGGGARRRMPLRPLLVAGAVPVSAELERDALHRPHVHQLLRWDSIVTTVLSHLQATADTRADSGHADTRADSGSADTRADSGGADRDGGR